MPTTYPQTITNPGAESGFAGWTATVGAPAATSSQHHTGSFAFQASASGTGAFEQSIALSGAALLTAIDHGQVSASLAAWLLTSGGTGGFFPGAGTLYARFYSSGNYLLGISSGSSAAPLSWTQETLSATVPAGTRTVVIGCTSNSFGSNTYWDDFTLDLIDSGVAVIAAHERVTQAVAYAVGQTPSAHLRVTQAPLLAVSGAVTANGNYHVRTRQVVAYALVRGKVDRMDLRAWTFLQDDHLFYGLNLGPGGTIVYDMLTQQWAQWFSPGYAYFRAEDVADWQGFNLACDTENGTLWKIDPTGRLDAGTTAIVSTVTGQATVRGRRTVPCYTAELACSQAAPSVSGTSIGLRTSDDGASSWVDHGTVPAQALGTATLFRYYGLGLMVAPGRIFELTNNGYCRRIDGLDIEIGQ